LFYDPATESQAVADAIKADRERLISSLRGFTGIEKRKITMS
jgi:hypothetical protein